MPEPQNQTEDPRAQLERMRKIKRLQELRAKAAGAKPDDVIVPYQSYAGSKPVDIMGWDPASLDDPDNMIDIVTDQFKRQREMQPKEFEQAATRAGFDARRRAAERMGVNSPLMQAAAAPALALAQQEGGRQVYTEAGTMLPDEAAGVNILNAQGVGIPGFVSGEMRDKIKQAYEDQPGWAITGEISGSVGPGELVFQVGKGGYNKFLRPWVQRVLPKGGNALARGTRLGAHGVEQAGAWAGQNAFYRGTTGASTRAAREDRAPTLSDVGEGAWEGFKDPINLAGPGLVGANRVRRYVSTGGATATPADRFIYAEDLAGGVPTAMVPGGRAGAGGNAYTQGASQPAWWQEAYQRIKIMLKNSGVDETRIKQGFDNIAANMAQNADGRTPIAMMIEREFADLGPQARENIRTFLLKGDLDKLPSVRDFIETSTNRSAEDYRNLIDTELTAERAAPAQEVIEKSLKARGKDYEKVLAAGKANIPNDAPLVVSMQEHLLTQTDGPMKATRVLAQEAKDRGWKDAETFIRQDPWNAAHEYRIRVAAAMRKSGDKAVELQPDLEFIDDFLGHLPGYNKIKQNYAKESGVRDALGWVDPETGKVTPSFGQELKKAARSERETEYAAQRYERMDPRQQQAARISTAETLRDATRGVRPQGTDQFGNDVLGLRLSMLPNEGFSSHALPRTFGEAGENVSRGIDDIVNRRQFVADINANTGSNTVNKALAHQTGDDALIQGMSRDATRNTANNPGRTVDIAMLANGLPPVLWFVQKFPGIFRGLVTPGRTTRNDIARILLAIPPSQRDAILDAVPMKPLSGRNSPRAWKQAYENDGENLPDVLKSPPKPPGGDGGGGMGHNGGPPMRSAGFNLQRPQGFHDDIPRGTARFYDERLTAGENKAVEMARNGYSNAEIAEEMGAEIGTVKVWLSKARSKGVDVPKARNAPPPVVAEKLYPRFERGQSDLQIAQITGMNPRTVASHRARFNEARRAAGEKPISSIQWKNAGGIGEDVQSSLMLGLAGNAGGDTAGRFIDLNRDGVVDEKDRELGRRAGSLAAGAPFAVRAAPELARNGVRAAGTGGRKPPKPPPIPGAGTGPKNRRHLGRGLKDLTDDNVVQMPQRKPANMGEGRTPEQLAEPFGGKPPSQWTPEEREFFVNSGHGSTADLDGGFAREYQTVDEVKKSLGRKGMKRANQGGMYDTEAMPVVGSLLTALGLAGGGAAVASHMSRNKPDPRVPRELSMARNEAVKAVAAAEPGSREYQIAAIRLQQIDQEIARLQSGNLMNQALMPPSRKPVAMTQ